MAENPFYVYPMRFEEIQEKVGHIPFISPRNARFLYDLVLKEQRSRILELGIAHGTATCFMAAALDELGEGTVTAVDLLEAKSTFEPSAEALVESVGLGAYVNIYREQSGYTWFLHDEISRNTNADRCQQVYDLCIIDGPKNWTIDGAAFFLADKLLRPGAWIIFDDYLWTYGEADQRRDSTDGITHRSLSLAERETPHVREVFELLVKQHPDYGELIVREGDDWALARKSSRKQKSYTVTYRETAGDVVGLAYRKLRHLLGR